MSTILFLDNHYINDLEQLQQLVVKSIKDDNIILYKEIETLFKDKVIHKWLEEGDIDCHKVLSSLILIPDKIDSSKLKEKIGNVFSDEQIQITRRYRDFIDLKNSAYSLSRTNYESFNDILEVSTELEVCISIRFCFMILKQDSESFNMSLLLDGKKITENQELDLRNYRDGESVNVTFSNITIKKGYKKGVFTLIVDDQTIKTFSFCGEYDRIFEIENKNGEIIKFNMLKVKGGKFNMTQDYQVELTDFYIGQYLVTQELWQFVMGDNPSTFVEPQNPVESVSWDSICKQHGFLYKLNHLLKDRLPNGWKFVLPTEAQWEYAARGGRKHINKNKNFAGVEMEALLPFFCWYEKNSNGLTHKVGTKNPNELYIYDMCGNVSEWCYDFYDNYPKGIYKNPKGSKNGYYRIYRGGSYIESANNCNLYARNYAESYYYYNTVGFRLCLAQI